MQTSSGVDNGNSENLPRHIAIIMDGNGRWAGFKHLPRISGHLKGIEAARELVRFSSGLGIKYLTLYTFSSENWNRPPEEVEMLMSLLEGHLRSETEDMIKNNIRFRAIGNMAELPEGVKDAVREAEDKTGSNSGMRLQLALSYGGRREIADACKAIAEKVKEGALSPKDVNEETVRSFLYTAGIPDPDLLIRTSGERRLSNFLLWQVAYTELYITDVLWPDFTKDHFIEAIRDYQARERRFGLTREQKTGVFG